MSYKLGIKHKREKSASPVYFVKIVKIYGKALGFEEERNFARYIDKRQGSALCDNIKIKPDAMNQMLDINTKITINTITTTEDRVKTVLQKHNSKGKKDWFGPLGIAITIAIAMFSSQWQVIYGIPVEVWTYFWPIALIIFAIWTIWAIGYNLMYYKDIQADDIINDLKM